MTIEVPQATSDFVHGYLAALKNILPYSEEYKGLDFSNSPVALVVNVVVAASNGLFLALKRTAINDSAAGLYNNVAGYMQGRGGCRDAVESTVKNELSEEAGLSLEEAASARIGVPFEVQAPNGRALHIVPGIVVFDRVPEIVLNPEHSEALWVTRNQYLVLPRIPAVDKVFDVMVGEAA